MLTRNDIACLASPEYMWTIFSYYRGIPIYFPRQFFLFCVAILTLLAIFNSVIGNQELSADLNVSPTDEFSLTVILSKVLWYHFKFHVLYVVLSFGISVHITPRFNCKKFTLNTCNSPSYIVESTNNEARGLKTFLGVRVCTRNTYCFCSVFRCSGMCPKHLQTSHKLETWHVLRT